MEMVEPGVGSRRHVVNADLRALGEQVGEKQGAKLEPMKRRDLT